MTSLMSKTFVKYLRLGIVPRITRENWDQGEFMYSIYHDDVPYAIDDMGDYELDLDLSYLMECLEARSLIIERHHALIKDIYEHAKKTLGTEVWVRVGCGMQLNVNFGDSNGAFASLMLDFADMEEFEKAVEKLKVLFTAETGEVPNFAEPANFVMIVENDDMVIFEGYKNDLVEILNIDDIDGTHDD